MAISNLGRVGLVTAMGAVAALGTHAPRLRFAPDQDPIDPEQAIQLDRYGNSLPGGAVARLGTVRWRMKGRNVVFSPDGKHFASGWDTLHVFDAQSGHFLRSIDTRAEDWHFSPDGK